MFFDRKKKRFLKYARAAPFELCKKSPRAPKTLVNGPLIIRRNVTAATAVGENISVAAAAAVT